MSHYRAYSEHVPSDVKWLGNIPKGWQVQPLKRLARVELSNVDKLTVEGQTPVRLCNYVDVYKNERITATLPFMEASASEDQIRRLSLKRSDVMMTKDSETPDDIGIPALVDHDMEGVVCGYHLALLRSDQNIVVGGYLQRVLQSAYAKAEFFCSALGLTRYGLSKYDIENLKLPVPPVTEQVSIAAALDRETARIDGLIAKKTEFIDLLAKKRHACITHAVTKGLDSKVKTRPSRVGWIGDVPEHWAVSRLGHFAAVENGSTPSKDNPAFWEEGTISWLGSGEVNQRFVTESTAKITELALQSCSLRVLPIDTVVIGMVGQGKTRGLSAILKIEAAINQNLAAVCVGPRLRPMFLFYVFGAAYDWLREAGRGSNQAAMNCEIVGEFKLAVPPLDEQDLIVSKLEVATARVEALSKKTQQSIELLRKRRFALITAAVTGQIDLRESA